MKLLTTGEAMKTIKAREFNQAASSYARSVLETGEPIVVTFRGAEDRVMLVRQRSDTVPDSLIAAGRAQVVSEGRITEVSVSTQNPQNVDAAKVVSDMRDEGELGIQTI